MKPRIASSFKEAAGQQFPPVISAKKKHVAPQYKHRKIAYFLSYIMATIDPELGRLNEQKSP